MPVMQPHLETSVRENVLTAIQAAEQITALQPQRYEQQCGSSVKRLLNPETEAAGGAQRLPLSEASALQAAKTAEYQQNAATGATRAGRPEMRGPLTLRDEAQEDALNARNNTQAAAAREKWTGKG